MREKNKKSHPKVALCTGVPKGFAVIPATSFTRPLRRESHYEQPFINVLNAIGWHQGGEDFVGR
jgi:hypothetical protein